MGWLPLSLRPVKIEAPVNHPDYFQDEGYNHKMVFFGIPLVKLGEVVGVLVMELSGVNLFSEDDEAILLTLGSHLALIVADTLLKTEKSITL